MKTKKLYYIILPVLLTLFSCTDPYKLQTNNYDEALVIEATLTNELKQQEIKITKTYRLEQNAPTTVSDAVVIVTDSQGNNYDFMEQNGIYVSVNPFQAEPNKTYKLQVITEDGKTYSSTNETLTTASPITSITPTVGYNNGVRGVEMVVHSNDPSNSSKYYRYEYEETNKIIAPKWVPVKAIVINGPAGSNPPGTISLIPRTTEARVCYSTKKSDKIIITNTNDLQQDQVNFSVRFIKDNDYIIANRYSILVKQYVENLAAYTFYRTLKELSGTESILSQTQPGFFSGNIKCDSNENEKVIGFFEVASVSSQRIFFNYNEVFPGETVPKYPYKCEIDPENPEANIFNYCFSPFDFSCAGYTVLSLLGNGTSVYYNFFDNKYELYPTPCGDCTSFSSNVIPSFWIN